MVTLYQMEESPFCDKIRRALRWKRIAFEIHEVSLVEVLTSYRKVNTIRKVPALNVDGHVIADSTDIAHYVDERWPERPLFPQDPAQRALCHILEDWADESLYFYEMRLRFTFPTNRARWVPALLAHDDRVLRPFLGPVVARAIRQQCAAQGVGRKPPDMVLRDVDRHVDAVSAWLAGKDWLVGSGLTLADIAVFAQLRCIDATGEGSASIGARPAVRAWMTRVAEATGPEATP